MIQLQSWFQVTIQVNIKMFDSVETHLLSSAPVNSSYFTLSTSLTKTPFKYKDMKKMAMTFFTITKKNQRIRKYY